jgi:hypothetical protein
LLALSTVASVFESKVSSILKVPFFWSDFINVSLGVGSGSILAAAIANGIPTANVALAMSPLQSKISLSTSTRLLGSGILTANNISHSFLESQISKQMDWHCSSLNFEQCGEFSDPDQLKEKLHDLFGETTVTSPTLKSSFYTFNNDVTDDKKDSPKIKDVVLQETLSHQDNLKSHNNSLIMEEVLSLPQELFEDKKNGVALIKMEEKKSYSKTKRQNVTSILKEIGKGYSEKYSLIFNFSVKQSSGYEFSVIPDTSLVTNKSGKLYLECVVSIPHIAYDESKVSTDVLLRNIENAAQKRLNRYAQNPKYHKIQFTAHDVFEELLTLMKEYSLKK